MLYKITTNKCRDIKKYIYMYGIYDYRYIIKHFSNNSFVIHKHNKEYKIQVIMVIQLNNDIAFYFFMHTNKKFCHLIGNYNINIWNLRENDLYITTFGKVYDTENEITEWINNYYSKSKTYDIIKEYIGL